MRLTDLCTHDPVTIGGRATLVEAAQRMRARHVGLLVVTDDGAAGTPIGVLTDRDIVVEVVSAGVDPTTVVVEDVMTRDPLLLRQDTRAEDALAKLRAYGVRRAPVVDAAGALVGVIALDDLIEWIARSMQSAVGIVGHEQRIERQQRA